MVEDRNAADVNCHELDELTDSLDDEAALRRRAESVAVVS